jgi:hypothetical protein
MIKLRLDDPKTRAVWAAVQKAKAEVESWPAWKRGEALTTSKNKIMWTLQSALEVVNELTPLLKAANWYVALGGGVLNRGESSHDLDLVMVPYSTERVELFELYNVFVQLGWERTHDAFMVQRTWRKKNSTDNKHVEVWESHGRRIDVIIPSVIKDYTGTI